MEGGLEETGKEIGLVVGIELGKGEGEGGGEEIGKPDEGGRIKKGVWKGGVDASGHGVGRRMERR